MGEEHQEKGHGLCKAGNGPRPATQTTKTMCEGASLKE